MYSCVDKRCLLCRGYAAFHVWPSDPRCVSCFYTLSSQCVLVVQVLAQALTPSQLALVCPHFSLKNNYGGGADAALHRFEEFCVEAAQLQVKEVLLVSGSGSRAFDTVACLNKMSVPADSCPEIGVAFNPYFPDRPSRERERARLKLKLNSQRVTAIWLQIGLCIMAHTVVAAAVARNYSADFVASSPLHLSLTHLLPPFFT